MSETRNRSSRLQIESAENTPLNISNYSNQQSIMDSETKRVMIKIVVDIVLLGCVGFPVLMFFLFGVPYERGFFCNDESLMHPFHESTVTHDVLYIVGFGIPIISVREFSFFTHDHVNLIIFCRLR